MLDIRLFRFFGFIAAVCMCLNLATRGDAHEVQPTIADLQQDGDTLTLSLRMNAEALLSGIDLDGLADTDDAEDNAAYDDLRELQTQDLANRIPRLLGVWNSLPMVKAGDTPLALQVQSVTVEPQPNFELPRVSILALTAVLPDSASSVVVSWPAGSGALVLRQQGVEEPYTGYLDLGASSPPIALAGGGAASGWQSFVGYIPVGFDHILPKGLDHILFVLGLFFLSTKVGPLLWQVTSFTLAHTVTLALGALGVVNVPGSIVEPLIAASIVFVAVENIFARGLTTWRPFIIFAFGLLHGLGFASVLQDFGLPSDQFIPALIGFNVGVEVGQLTVIAMAAIWVWLTVRAVSYVSQNTEDYADVFRPLSVGGSILIAIVGVYWVIERVFL
ncbi:MAG: HupE/UreJ family protein [Rhodobacteraceae bacterium]|nr:HupE/UreJ family protein [Paracoccaceae bacterium]